jgi:hypothetical protein
MTSANTRPVAADVATGPQYADGETVSRTRPPRQVRLFGHPRSRIGTIATTGPYARLRLNVVQRYQESYAAWALIIAGGMPVRRAAAMLGLSPTTSWRRAHWFGDQNLNRAYGLPDGPPPRQRGTRLCPHGRPIVLPHDAGWVIDVLLADGYRLEDIAASTRTIPVCVRRLAARMAALNHMEKP